MSIFFFSAMARSLAGQTRDSNLSTAYAAVAPQQFQSSSSTSSIPRASQAALVEVSYSFAVAWREQPGK